jgi:UDP-N-acetylglucosamine--N-acetylmuramyl-(pentapeptide) pyrophosphoryl-undecaprenol N-acetylglucosamine transferase
MREPDFTAEALAATIEQFLTTPSLLAVAAEKARAMGAPDATERLADLAERLIAERRVLGAAA